MARMARMAQMAQMVPRNESEQSDEERSTFTTLLDLGTQQDGLYAVRCVPLVDRSRHREHLANAILQLDGKRLRVQQSPKGGKRQLIRFAQLFGALR